MAEIGVELDGREEVREGERRGERERERRAFDSVLCKG